MNFSELAKSLDAIEQTTSRLEMTDMLVDLLQKLKGEEVKHVLYLINGRVVPRFVPLEFNISRGLMKRSIAQGFEKSDAEVEQLFSKQGDLGLVAESLQIATQSTISVNEIYNRLFKIASYEGTGSQTAKIDGVATLLRECDALGCRYIVRMILGSLRLGLSTKTVLDGLSIVAVGDKSKRSVLDRAYGLRSDIGYIARTVIDEGIESLEDVSIQPGVPVLSMNCEREAGVEDVLNRHDTWIIQPKYDGLRAQIHYAKSEFEDESFFQRDQRGFLDGKDAHFRVYSRNLENLTEMFPDVGEAMIRLGKQSIVLDCEIVGYDTTSNTFQSFQETIQRRRKYNVKESVKNIPIRAYVFDILLLEDTDLSEKPLNERLRILGSVLEQSDNDDILFLSPSDVVSEKHVFDEVFKKHIESGVEGVIAKHPNSKYMPGKRGYDWIKLKKSVRGHLIDNVDCVVLGYYYGRGTRARFGIGALLVGVRNKKKGTFESIAKVGTGIKDDDWVTIKNRLDALLEAGQPKNVTVSKELAPDVWVTPEVVTVVDADEITKSPSHRAGFKEGKGFSLRFPRLKVFDRKDKTADMITSVTEIRKLYTLQSRQS